MINEPFGQMWNILKENDFQIDAAIKAQVMCTSCKNVMIKPCVVACGCRYCYDCLMSYLNGENKFCLGESVYCKSGFINIDKDVYNDQAVSIKISRIIVKCPLESCEFNTELMNMENHMLRCNSQPMTCPYYTIGCETSKIGVKKMELHFKQENYCHAKLLMDFVDNWRNEMKVLRTNVLDLHKENKSIKEQMESQQVKYISPVLIFERNFRKPF